MWNCLAGRGSTNRCWLFVYQHLLKEITADLNEHQDISK